MNKPAHLDTAALNLMLSELRLPTIKSLWPQFTEQADREGWPAARLLSALTEHEIADRARRRFQRRLGEARLPSGKTLATFDFSVVPMVSKAHVMALSAGDRWLDEGANLLLIGPPGTGKSHLSAAIGLALVENGYRVLFCRTTDLAQRLQVARRELVLEAAISKLDKFHLLVLDDFAYVTKDQAETSVLFELISTRYEQRSMLITANQPFGQWEAIFPDHAMTVAAIDRLVHRATIFELNVESYRRRTAVENKHRRQRAPAPQLPTTGHGCRAAGDCAPATQKSSDRRVRGCHSWKLSEGPPTLWPRTLGAWPQKPAPYRPLSAFSPGRVGHGYPLDLAQADSSPRMPRLDLRTRPANLRSPQIRKLAARVRRLRQPQRPVHPVHAPTIRGPTRRLSATRSQPPTRISCMPSRLASRSQTSRSGSHPDCRPFSS